jgi:hypothetical protein
MAKLWWRPGSWFWNRMTTRVFAQTASSLAWTHREPAVTCCPSSPSLETATNPRSLAPHRCRVSWTARLRSARIGGIPDSSQMIEPAV